MKKSWIQDPETGKLIPKEEYLAKKHAEESRIYVQGNPEPFVSPIDGSVIHSRRQLAEHNKRLGVTDVRDYGDDWFERKAKERAHKLSGKASKADRIEAIRRSLYQHGVID